MILFIDDERRYMINYVEELQEADYEVAVHTSVDTASAFFQERAHDVELIILDIMMSPGKTFSHEDTDGGLRTGVRFYERVREKSPDLPVIILTNASAVELSDRFSGDQQCWYRQKKDFLPVEVTQEVKRILSQG